MGAKKTTDYTLANRNGSSLLDIPAWSVSDTKLLSLSGNGNTVTVKGLKKGTAQAVAVYHGRKYICTIKVAQTIKLNKTKMTLTVGKTGKLKLLGVKASKVLWGVKDSNGVVSVSDSGKVTAKKKGTATVIAQVKGKKKQYTCKVTVKAKSGGLEGIYTGTYKSYYFWDSDKEKTGTCKFVVKKKTGTESIYTISLTILSGGGGAGFTGSPDLSAKNGIIDVKSSDKDYKGTGTAHFRVDGTNLIYYQSFGSRYIDAKGSKAK